MIALLLALAALVGALQTDTLTHRTDAAARQVAITFDDVPRQAGGISCRDPEAVVVMNERLVSRLAARNVPAVALVTGGNACPPDRAAHLERVLDAWLDAGLEVGLHTWSHPDLNGTTVQEFLADADRGAALLERALARRGQRLRWFRHPFLHTGNTRDKKRALVDALTRRRWDVAPVTFDNDEWIYAAAYRRALEAGDPSTARRIVADYVAYMARTFTYFEGISERLFQRQIPQVLLVHASPLNAAHFDRVLDALEARGYTFISLDQAVSDPAYRSHDGYLGTEGLSWLLRWARTRGLETPPMPRASEWVRSYDDTG